MPPPPPSHTASASPPDPLKIEAPRAPHLYPSQSLFPRDSAAMDAMIGLKTLATHAGAQAHLGTPPRPLQMPYRPNAQPQQQRPGHGYDLPALHIPPPQQFHSHGVQAARTGGEAVTPVRADGGPLQQSLLPPPVVTRRGSGEEATTQREQPSDIYASPATAQRLPPMTQSPPPLITLLGRKNKRGEPRVLPSASASQVPWDDVPQGRLDPTASPPRPLSKSMFVPRCCLNPMY